MDDRHALAAQYRDGLLHDTLPFWFRHAVDAECGGFHVAVDRDGTLLDTDKGVWQQARFTWLLGEIYNLGDLPETAAVRSQCLDLARHGADFLEKHCFDPADGRMWFLVDREGNPLRKRRYAFTESFAAIAFGELARATGEERYTERAKQTFDRFITHVADAKCTDTRPARGLGFPMIAIVTAQELRDSIDLEGADELIDGWIREIRDLHVREDLGCVLETCGPSGEFLDHFDGRLLNPGHAIEAAWFLMREADHRGDPELLELGCRVLDLSWERGWDEEHGGILYFVDAKGLPVTEYWHDMKFWWPHNEAVLATLYAALRTNDAKYAAWHRQVHDWAHAHFADPEHGEWFGYLRRDGSVSSRLKGNHWKGPFHLPRMQLVAWRLLAEAKG